MIDTHRLTVIGEHDCLQLMEHTPVGRLGFSSAALPVIFPVNFVVRDRSAIIGSDEGEKARAARQGAVACLEVDQYDVMGHSGWSVLATGRLSVVDPAERDEMEHLPLLPWALGVPPLYLELAIELISGRRLT